VEVLVSGVSVPRYFHHGTIYLEAFKGKEYAIRITNPIGARIAVALSVDGLNTIDARHTEARSGSKWVLGPYESIEIRGWQTNSQNARRFFFTTEAQSYGAWLGQTENLGIISAAFFREKAHWAQQPILIPHQTPPSHPDNSPAARNEQPQADSAGLGSQEGKAKASSLPSQAEYAATGIGERIRHEVQRIHMDLEDQPFSTVSLRYEFRSALVRLGIVRPVTTTDPLIRRQQARGFREEAYCPEP
jgi:hypothetical protein